MRLPARLTGSRSWPMGAGFNEEAESGGKEDAQPACNHLRAPNGVYFASGAKTGKTAILFPGQGSQFHRMLEQICLWNARARDWFCSLDEAYEAAGLPAATRLLYPSGAASTRPMMGSSGSTRGEAPNSASRPVSLSMNSFADWASRLTC